MNDEYQWFITACPEVSGFQAAWINKITQEDNKQLQVYEDRLLVACSAA